MASGITNAQLDALIEEAYGVSPEMALALIELKHLRFKQAQDETIKLTLWLTPSQARGLSLVASRLTEETIARTCIARLDGNTEHKAALTRGAKAALAGIEEALAAGAGIVRHHNANAPASSRYVPTGGKGK